MYNKIQQIVLKNLEIYLENHLKKVPEEKHSVARDFFIKDIARISNYIRSHFFEGNPHNPFSQEKENITFIISFIKGLHKNLYPEGYIQKSKDNDGKEFIWMIPGEYREIKIVAKESVNQDIYAPFQKIESDIINLITKFQSSISKATTKKAKIDTILNFAIDFITIHPFGDGNGRIDGILVDILCLKYETKPLYLVKMYKKYKMPFISALEKTRKTKNIDYLYNFIEKHSEIE